MSDLSILYLINGLGFSRNTGIGGSDKRAVEIIRHIKKIDSKSDLDILTTQTGYKLFKNYEKLDTKYYVIKKPFWWPKFINKYLVGRILSYFYACLASLLKARKVKGFDLYFATSDFFFDVIPGWFFKMIHNKKLICMIHHHIKSPKERSGSLVINSFMYFSQRFSFWLISKTADVIFLYDTEEGKKIKKIISKSVKHKTQFYFVKNGIDSNLIDSVKDQEKTYEACFLGGLRYSKGISEFVPIWKQVTSEFPNAKFLVIGGGSTEIVNRLEEGIKKAGLENNIILTGPLSGKKLFEKIKSSKVFLFPSHEEGWGIAIFEAMYCGLPIVCYDLPAFKIFEDAVDKFEIGNHESLAERVNYFLGNQKEIENKKLKLISIAQKFSWENIAQEELRIYKKINFSS